ncbi:MAG: hypothetical protein ABIP80_03745 [Ferruginibacter sp.]
MRQIYIDDASWIEVLLPLFKMTPDYPHKLFGDKRLTYSLLMITLAMDSESN